MLQENISEKNGFIRLALGAGMTAYGIAHLSRENSSRSLGSLLVTAGAMKMAEGVFLYCPMKAVVNSNVKNAVNTSFEEFMDGDSLMEAFRSTYENSNNTNKNHSSQSSGSSNSGKNVAETVVKAAESTGSLTSAASQAVAKMAQEEQSNSSSSQMNH